MERKLGEIWKEINWLSGKPYWCMQGNERVLYFYKKRDAKELSKNILKVAKQYK